MIIWKARVSAKGDRKIGVVTLSLEERQREWTYRVEDVSTGGFHLTWRAKSPEHATRKLMDVYHPDAWDLTAVDSQTDDLPAADGNG
jgi:hypothetical protein